MNLFPAKEKNLKLTGTLFKFFKDKKLSNAKKKRATLPSRFNGNMKTITHMYIAYYILVFDSPLKTGIERVS